MSYFGRRFTLSAIVVAIAVVARPALAQQVVTITVPTGVSFNVVDVTATTSGSPAPTSVSYSTALNFTKTQQLKVSVQATSSTFSGPGTTHPAASKISWTATAAAGSASNGTLSSTAYTQVYLSPKDLKVTSSGSVNLTWTLAAIAATGLRSGTHTLTVRWKFEAI
jgi:hypothetical protein